MERVLVNFLRKADTVFFFLHRHNAAALALVKLATQQLPKVVNIAYFDTTFHTRSIPPHVYTYPLDPEMARKKMIRKYGFHGISYSFVLREAAGFLQKVGFLSFPLLVPP